MYAVQKTSGTPLNASRSQVERRRPKSRRLAWGIAVGWVILDQITKVWAQDSLAGREPVPVLGELLQLRLVYNSGAAFSIGQGNTWIFTILASIVVSYLIWHTRQIEHRGWACALGLLIGGAGGNLVDRLTREPGFGRGHVVDFLALPNFPVFNVADIGITTAAVLIALLVLRGEDESKGKGDEAAQAHDGEVNRS
ncbi:signal peptidase II [soil metagenome]